MKNIVWIASPLLSQSLAMTESLVCGLPRNMLTQFLAHDDKVAAPFLTKRLAITNKIHGITKAKAHNDDNLASLRGVENAKGIHMITFVESRFYI